MATEDMQGELLYEYENIQAALNRMTETELESKRAHQLIERADAIRQQWGQK